MNSKDVQSLLTDEKQFKHRVKVVHITFMKGKIVLLITAIILFINAYVAELTLSGERNDIGRVSSNYWSVFFRIDFKDQLFSSLLLIAAFIGLAIGISFLVIGYIKKDEAYANAHYFYLSNPEIRIYNTIQLDRNRFVFIENDISKQLALEIAIRELFKEDKQVIRASKKYVAKSYDLDTYLNILKTQLVIRDKKNNFDFVCFHHYSFYKLEQVAVSESAGLINTTVNVDGIGLIELTIDY